MRRVRYFVYALLAAVARGCHAFKDVDGSRFAAPGSHRPLARRRQYTSISCRRPRRPSAGHFRFLPGTALPLSRLMHADGLTPLHDAGALRRHSAPPALDSSGLLGASISGLTGLLGHIDGCRLEGGGCRAEAAMPDAAAGACRWRFEQPHARRHHVPAVYRPLLLLMACFM